MLLQDYHDKEVCEYIRYGWPVGYTAPGPPETTYKNHDSANKHIPHVEEFVAKELKLGGIIGPFTSPPFTPWFHVAPVMTRPKSDSKQRRVILDLSYPNGGVNAGITKNCLEGKATNYTLPSIDDLTLRLQELGQGPLSGSRILQELIVN